MNNLKTVFDFVLMLLNTRLNFAPFSFTIWQYFLCLFGISIFIFFVRELFLND